MTGWSLRDAELAAAARRAQQAEADAAVLRLRLALAPWTVPAGPDPRRRVVRVASIPAPRRP